MAHVQLHESMLASESVKRLPDNARAYFPWDILASSPDAYGCFQMVQSRWFGNLLESFPSETLEDVSTRIDIYRREGMLEVWEEDGKTWGHWIAWFKPTGGRNRNGVSRVNSRPNPGKATRKTPLPPSYRRFSGDPNNIKNWKDLQAATSYKTATAERLDSGCPAVAEKPPGPITITTTTPITTTITNTKEEVGVNPGEPVEKPNPETPASPFSEDSEEETKSDPPIEPDSPIHLRTLWQKQFQAVHNRIYNGNRNDLRALCWIADTAKTQHPDIPPKDRAFAIESIFNVFLNHRIKYPNAKPAWLADDWDKYVELASLEVRKQRKATS